MAEQALPRHQRQAITLPVIKARQLLYVWFILMPIIAGADKFFHFLVDWNRYLAAPVAEWLPISGAAFMLLVGVIEILAGMLVAARPQVGSIIVGCWLLAIATNLVLAGYYDIAVRDIGLAIGAFALYELS